MIHSCDLELNNNILSYITCPSCKENLTRPVFLCSLGHSICSTCRRLINRCPICARSLLAGTHVRNWALESVIDLLLYPCPNSEFGCRLSCKYDELKWHTEICEYREYQCLITDTKQCPWQGRSADLREHILKDHKQELCMEDGKPAKWISDAYGFNVDTQMLFYQDEIFWVHRKQQDGLLCWAVQYIGSQEESNFYSFSLDITNAINSQNADTEVESYNDRMLPLTIVSKKISLQGGVQPDVLTPQELFKNPLRYVCMSVRVFLMYKNDDDNIIYTVNIHNMKNDTIISNMTNDEENENNIDVTI